MPREPSASVPPSTSDSLFQSEVARLIAPVARSVLDAVIALDGNGFILEWNDLAASTFGWTREEAIGKSMGQLIVPPVHRSAHFAGMRRYQQTGEQRVINKRIEISAIDKTGREFPVELAIVDLRVADRFVFIGFLRDISSRREAEDRLAHSEEALRQLNATLETRVEERTSELRLAEEALRQAQKMEAVGQLTGGIAHDFNNLLQGITGSLDLLQRRLSQGRTGELDRFITGAMTSANRATALTHRLLAFSRRQPLDPRPLRVNPLVASMEDLLRRTLSEHIDLELVLAGGLWLTLCDANQLESAILNLVINARDAMKGGGKLTVETCNAHLDSAYAAKSREVRPGQYICVGVSDTGIGMDANTIARAFEPFFTTKPIGQGTGLGLSMIYGFTHQSGGYAKIYSELGRGTTVKLYLPRYQGEEREELEESPAEITSPEPGATVLVVEDEPIVRGLVVEVLTDLGYHALEAADGNSGLAILQSKRRIDLLITDVGLPGLNGRQIADAARAFRPNLKVLFMTGYAENATIAAGFLEPGMAMITKPFAMAVLASRIQESIDKS